MTHLTTLLKPTWGKVDATRGEPFVGTIMEGRQVSSPLARLAARHAVQQEVTHADRGGIHFILEILLSKRQYLQG
jgi:hypothetical protein